jgi:hypothetical protein
MFEYSTTSDIIRHLTKSNGFSNSVVMDYQLACNGNVLILYVPMLENINYSGGNLQSSQITGLHLS